MDLEQFISGVETVPPSIRVLAKLSTLIGDYNSTIADVVELIGFDPSLTSVILRVSNSALFGGNLQVTNLEDAVNRLGFREVYRITAAVSARHVLERDLTAYGLTAVELWNRSLACAIMIEILAGDTGDNPATCYTLGLLHRIGRWAINKHLDDFRPDVSFEPEAGLSVSAWEKRVMGFDSARVGGALLKKWGFPVDIHIPVTHHIEPLAAPFLTRQATLLAIAERSTGKLMKDALSPFEDQRLLVKLLSEVGLSEELIDSRLPRVRDNLGNVQLMLGVQSSMAQAGS